MYDWSVYQLFLSLNYGMIGLINSSSGCREGGSSCRIQHGDNSCYSETWRTWIFLPSTVDSSYDKPSDFLPLVLIFGYHNSPFSGTLWKNFTPSTCPMSLLPKLIHHKDDTRSPQNWPPFLASLLRVLAKIFCISLERHALQFSESLHCGVV